MHHLRKNRNKYVKANAGDPLPGEGCSLCMATNSEQIVEQTPTMCVIKNRTPYDMFEGLRTASKHYMILPKRHVVHLAEFTKEERLEMFELVAKYEQQGLSIYARSTSNVNRSQRHQHTHLIQTSNKKIKGLVYLKKPYILKIVD